MKKLQHPFALTDRFQRRDVFMPEGAIGIGGNLGEFRFADRRGRERGDHARGEGRIVQIAHPLQRIRREQGPALGR